MIRRFAPAFTPWRGAAVTAMFATGGLLLSAGAWIPVKAEVAQYLLNRAWAATQDGAERVRPWPWADTWPIARLHLPTADEPLVVLAGASARNLAFGPVHLEGSAEPGTAGVSIIAGHRDTHFAALRELHPGDRLYVESANGGVAAYVVTAVDVVDAERATLRTQTDESVLALVTCWPFDAVTPGGPMRYVVTAAREAEMPRPELVARAGG
ncbi:MAG TPA: class GN sortase [Gammaproteobacteria bacterium]